MEASVEEHINYLTSARAAVAELERMKSEDTVLTEKRIRLQRTLANEEKTLSDEIALSIKRKRDALCAGYDAEIEKAQEKLKRYRSRKEHAKNEGKRERIEYETTELREENQALMNEFLGLIKKRRLPAVTKNRWFYVYFMPKGAFEILLASLTAILFCYVLPLGIFTLSGAETPFILTIMSMAFGICYAAVYAGVTTKIILKDPDVIKRTASLLRRCEANNRNIKHIARSITKDEGEEYYELDSYNYDIAKAEAMVEDAASRKAEALESFDTVNVRVIEDELREERREKLEELTRELQVTLRECQISESQIKEATDLINDRYAKRIGPDNLNAANLTAMIKVMKNGEAVTITEASNICRTNKWLK